MRLFLCEKPSQGKDIGRILGATQRGEGCLSGSGVTITWCIGHLVEAAAPEVYDAALKRWSLEQLPIIPQQWRVEVKPKTATQFKVVKALLAKATHLVIATDADREGELIAREIIDLCGYRGHPGRIPQQAGRLDFAVDRAVRQHVPVHQASPWASMSAVRRSDAPAHRQERPILVVQSLPRLQRHAAGRIRYAQAWRFALA